MNIVIRNEEEKDYREVESIVREAFWNLYIPGCEEYLVVHKMRNHEDYIKDLSFVLEIDGELCGAIFYTKSKIEREGKEDVETISFGPVCISPKLHRKGFGKMLIEYSIQKAKEQGHRAILTLGYPYHYEPYGFLGGKRYGICMGDGQFYKGLLVLPLYENSLRDTEGIATFSNVFEISKEELKEFDKNFSYKEKCIKDSQREYEEACCLLDK
ncbi:MAG: GNAT family N-acetyltransferase [Clostridium sp.]|uniref:GNAT family N-acetyltransferase n=1 Tax=Clostridium sp. TaxID=1506 RepID=UPI003F397BCA